MPQELVVRVRGRDAGAIAMLNRVSQAVHQQRQAMVGLAEVSTGLGAASAKAGAGALALAGGLGYLGKAAGDYDEKLRQVNTMAHLSGQGFKKMHADVLEIARDPLVMDMPAKLAEGLYQVNSSGFSGAEGMELLHSASVLATAGVTDTRNAAADMMAVMNAYNLRTGPQAQQVADQLFKTVELGVLEFEDLNGQLGGVAALGGTLQVPFEQLEAGLVVMTRRGFNAAEALTALERIQTTFLQPSKELTAALKKQGYESGMTAIKQLGLVGAMRLLQQMTGNDQAELAKLIPEQRALRAALSLTADGGKLFGEMLGELATSQGAVGRAAAEIAEGPMAQYKTALKELQVEAIKLGETEILPAATELIRDVRDLVKWFSELPASTRHAYVQFAIGTAKALALAAAIGAVVRGAIGLYQTGRTIATAGKAIAGWFGARMAGGAAAAGAESAAAAEAGSAAGAASSAAEMAAAATQQEGGAARAIRTVRRRPISQRRLADAMIWEGQNSKAAALADRMILGPGAGGSSGMVVDAADAELGAAWEREGLTGAGRRATATGNAARLARRNAVANSGWGRFVQANRDTVGAMAERSEIVKSGRAIKTWTLSGDKWSKALSAGRTGMGKFTTGLGKVSGSLKSWGAGLMGQIGPMLALSAALAIMEWSVRRTANMYGEMRQAQKEEQQATQDVKTADTQAAAGGVWTMRSQARSQGYSEKEIDQLEKALGDPNNKRYEEARRLNELAMKKTHNAAVKASAERQYQRNKATSEANLKAELERQRGGAQPVGYPSQGPKFGAAPAGQGGLYVPPSGPTQTIRRGQTVNVVNINGMTFSDPEQMKRWLNQQLDEQLRPSAA